MLGFTMQGYGLTNPQLYQDTAEWIAAWQARANDPAISHDVSEELKSSLEAILPILRENPPFSDFLCFALGAGMQRLQASRAAS
ncbi:hypothetical protein HY29_16055 [Hyphomonas beringensis]|uniref:Uncharacterized protein n=2 Tax=Hyphomonas beringensis TaxID=1280946 RepID=A0A062U087_9PROT|nr:hypothetical protein HY29_16055 [Hyphomonas beringensis]